MSAIGAKPSTDQTLAARSETQRARRWLGGLGLGEIPIAGHKFHSMALSLNGKLYQIGKISPQKAFVIIRGNLRLLYVAPDYANYRYAARKVFGHCAQGLDIDHALGRELTKHKRVWYTLVARIDRATNRSHGFRERPPLEPAPLSFEKFYYIDERILRKILGLPNGQLPDAAQTFGYEIAPSHVREMTVADALRARHALGMNGRHVHLPFLRLMERRRRS